MFKTLAYIDPGLISLAVQALFVALARDDVGEPQARKDQDQPHQGQAHADLVTDHLAGGADAPQKGELVVGRPASHDHAIGGKAGDGQDVQQADTDKESDCIK